MSVIPGTHMDDISEFQPNFDWNAYAKVRTNVIIRAAYGYSHLDTQWSNNQVARDGRFKTVGIYLYVVATEDAAAQANYFGDLIGTLKDGEFLLIDMEEGDGDQQGRLNTFLSILDQRFHRETGEYSYVPFIQSHLASFETDGERLRWVAGYGSAPGIPWDLWQHTDGTYGNHDCQPAYPGAPSCDCSVYPGTSDQFYALVMRNGSAPPPAAPASTVYPLESNVNLTCTPMNIGLDPNGNGWTERTDIPFAQTVSVMMNGADPRHAGYIPVPTPSENSDNGNLQIEIVGGPKAGTVGLWIWHVA